MRDSSGHYRVPQNDGEDREKAHVDETSQPAWRVICLAIAAASLGYALQQRDGLFEPLAFKFLTLSLISAIVALFPPKWPVQLHQTGCHALAHPETTTIALTPTSGREHADQQNAPASPAQRPEPSDETPPPRITADWPITTLTLLILSQFLQMLLADHPGSWHAPQPDRLYYALVTLFALPAFAMIAAILKCHDLLARRLFFPLFLTAFFILGFWWLKSVPQPFTDVWEAQRAGLQAAAAGKSPFNAPFPDIYNNPPAYSSGTIVRNGMVELGFPYPPLSLLLELPGHLLAGDFRYANLVYITAAAALIGYARPGPFPMLAAALFLTTARTLFILECGFTEASMAFLLALLIFAACRQWRITPILLGLFFASKQYLIVAAPCALLLIPPPFHWRKAMRWAAIAIAAALLVSLPLILLDPSGFVRSSIMPSLNAHFRYDSLSYPALQASLTGQIPPSSLAFIFTAIGIALSFWRLPRSAWAFAMSLALVLMLLFAFSSGAFCNYYYFIIALFCCAIAAQNPPPLPAPTGENPYDAQQRQTRTAAVHP